MTITFPRRISSRPSVGLSRRRFLSTAAAASAGTLGTLAMPYLSRAADRPQITHGVQSGDVGADGGVVWARADRPAQMMVEVATTESFNHARVLPRSRRCPRATSPRKCCWRTFPPGRTFSTASDSAICRIRTYPASR